MPVVHGGSVQTRWIGTHYYSFARFSHAVETHPHADYRSLDAVQPEATGKLFSTGQVTSNVGATLLLAARLVTGGDTGYCTTGSTPTQGTVLRKNKPQ